MNKQQLETIQQIPFNIIIIDFPDNGDYYSTPLAIKCMNSWKKVFPNAIFKKYIITQKEIQNLNSYYIQYFETLAKTDPLINLKLRYSDIFRLVKINENDNAIYMDADVLLDENFINYFVSYIYDCPCFFIGKMLGTFIWNKKKNNYIIDQILDYFDVYFLNKSNPIKDADNDILEKYFQETLNYNITDSSSSYFSYIYGQTLIPSISHPYVNNTNTYFINIKNFKNDIIKPEYFEEIEDLLNTRNFKIIYIENKEDVKKCIDYKFKKDQISFYDIKDINEFPSRDNIHNLKEEFKKDSFLFLTIPKYIDSKSKSKKDTILEIAIVTCDKDVHLLNRLGISVLEKIKDYPLYELTIWDNTTSGKAKDIYNHLQKFYSNTIHYYTSNENLYQFEGRKRIIQKSTSDYIWFLDCDDQIIDIPLGFEKSGISIYGYTLNDNQKTFEERNIYTKEDFLKYKNEYKNEDLFTLWNKVIKTNVLKYAVENFIPEETIIASYSEDNFYFFSSLEVIINDTYLPITFKTQSIYKHYINDLSSSYSDHPNLRVFYTENMKGTSKLIQLFYLLSKIYTDFNFQMWVLTLFYFFYNGIKFNPFIKKNIYKNNLQIIFGKSYDILLKIAENELGYIDIKEYEKYSKDFLKDSEFVKNIQKRQFLLHKKELIEKFPQILDGKDEQQFLKELLDQAFPD